MTSPSERNIAAEVHQLHALSIKNSGPQQLMDECLHHIRLISEADFTFFCLFAGVFSHANCVISRFPAEANSASNALLNLCRELPAWDCGAGEYLSRRFGSLDSMEIRGFLPTDVRSWCAHLVLQNSRPAGFLVLGSHNRDYDAEQRRAVLEKLSQELLRLLARQEFADWSSSRGHATHLIGYSTAILKTELLAKRFAPANCPVLITGETGTGKELIARMVHFYSSRRENPLVVINCGAFTSENLLASELFGHVKGAFTDARTAKKGKCELAHGGTLFLDEVSTMSMSMQIALLRTLRYGEIQKVGDDRASTKIDVRIVAACNEDLSDLVRRGLFREDVYSRLRVAHIHVPPLRERLEDLPILVDFFLQQICLKLGCPLKTMDVEAIRILSTRKWPHNIAGLENCLFHAALMSDDVITKEHLPLWAQQPSRQCEEPEEKEAFAEQWSVAPGCQTALKDAVARFEAAHIRTVLASCRDNISQTAKVLGISRQGLQKKLQRLNLSRQEGGTRAEDRRNAS